MRWENRDGYQQQRASYNQSRFLQNSNGGFMKRFGAQTGYLVFMLIVGVFISILPGCGGGGGGHWNEPVTTSSVTVTSTDPANGETGVFRNAAISATFSGAVDSVSLTTATFSVKQGTTIVPGT